REALLHLKAPDVIAYNSLQVAEVRAHPGDIFDGPPLDRHRSVDGPKGNLRIFYADSSYIGVVLAMLRAARASILSSDICRGIAHRSASSSAPTISWRNSNACRWNRRSTVNRRLISTWRPHCAAIQLSLQPASLSRRPSPNARGMPPSIAGAYASRNSSEQGSMSGPPSTTTSGPAGEGAHQLADRMDVTSKYKIAGGSAANAEDCAGSSEYDLDLIHAGKRLAEALHAVWTVVNVETSTFRFLPDRDRDRRLEFVR